MAHQKLSDYYKVSEPKQGISRTSSVTNCVPCLHLAAI